MATEVIGLQDSKELLLSKPTFLWRLCRWTDIQTTSPHKVVSQIYVYLVSIPTQPLEEGYASFVIKRCVQSLRFLTYTDARRHQNSTYPNNQLKQVKVAQWSNSPKETRTSRCLCETKSSLIRVRVMNELTRKCLVGPHSTRVTSERYGASYTSLRSTTGEWLIVDRCSHTHPHLIRVYPSWISTFLHSFSLWPWITTTINEGIKGFKVGKICSVLFWRKVAIDMWEDEYDMNMYDGMTWWIY